ncbi:MAG: Lacal_2735 family protein [Saprospiraceae bacterium]|nr:Lacal_2735 family protein [Bacteroidia bacterium]MBT8229531.1 Lacal_2735 family protein [Bacteroidia bacterium]NNF21549.1 Lacal_2735 family protein [Saprospiraceae bacterium]NNK90771.1 Lacal_2735 family protein [Saprospiraceae bacterium]
MFGLFKKKSPIDQLQKKYKKLLQEAHALSTSNRIESDKKHAEALEVLKEMEALEENTTL